jgi:2-(1,2-epoxy-1,2-dihydrophenyl)acetyl-CoA isomerase
MGIDYGVANGVASIRLARAEVSNAIDLATAEVFGQAVDHALADPEVRVVLLSGDGPRFCAGGDVASMVAAQDQGAYLEELAGVLDRALQRLATGAKPVVAAVQGAVAGAGLAVMLSCDLIVADEATKFVSAYAGVGLTPDCGLSWLLPRAVGQNRALELLLTKRALRAAEALEWGLVTEVVAPGTALERARQIAAEMASGPAHAYGQARLLARRAAECGRTEIGAEEARVIADAVTTPYAQQRLRAFVHR